MVCLASLVVPDPAFADCAHEIIVQAYRGQISSHFSQACYSRAIRSEPIDGSSYSDLDAVIRDAKRADALRGAITVTAERATVPHEVHTHPLRSPGARAATSPAPRTSTPPAGGGRDHAGESVRRPVATPPADDVTLLDAPSATPVLDRLAGNHADNVPVIVIALAMLAALLMLAGLAGALLRRRARHREA